MTTRPITFITTETNCNIPTSHIGDDGHGYPVITLSRKKVRIYKYLFEQKHGPVDSLMCIRHTCDNVKCINTDHLIIGTRAQNMHDKTERGRTARGDKNGRSKIMEHDALFILRSVQSTKKLAKKFNISCDTVLSIRSGKRWGYLSVARLNKKINGKRNTKELRGTASKI